VKVLYIEDNPFDADLTRHELRRRAPHITLEVVSTQQDALARLNQPSGPGYDVVLSDMRLPDGDGLTLLSHIRKQDLPVAVVIVTGSSDEEAVVAALKAGADDYVVKRADYLVRLPATLEVAVNNYRTQAARRMRPLRVLYVEDNDVDIDLTRRHLARHAPHIQLDAVNTVHAVLDPASGGNPIDQYDVLLLDYQLPGMNALEVMKGLRPVFGLDLPIVLVTGQGDEDVALQALKLGAADYLVKNPGYLYRLPTALENAFHRAQLAREQAALRASEERYRIISELTSDYAYTYRVDPDGGTELEWITEAFTRITGYTTGAVDAHGGWLSLVHPADQPIALRRARALANSRADVSEFRIVTRGGETRWLRDYSCPIWDEAQGRVVRIFGAAQDITERKRAEEALHRLNAELEQRVADRTRELAQANEQLHELDRLKSKFVSDVSHELRTPVTNLKLYLDLLERGNPDKHAHYRHTLKEQADRLSQLINNILDLSRLELGAAKVQFIPVDLNGLVEQIVVAHRPLAESAGLHLIFRPDPALECVRGERNQLAQVVTNLIANSINYTQTGQVQVSTSRTADRACMQVEDTGIGIDPEDVPHLFDRFYRGKQVAGFDIPGTGLGLAIVKEIVELHGGKIEVESRVSIGSTFRVWLLHAGCA